MSKHWLQRVPFMGLLVIVGAVGAYFWVAGPSDEGCLPRDRTAEEQEQRLYWAGCLPDGFQLSRASIRPEGADPTPSDGFEYERQAGSQRIRVMTYVGSDTARRAIEEPPPWAEEITVRGQPGYMAGDGSEMAWLEDEGQEIVVSVRRGGDVLSVEVLRSVAEGVREP